MIGRHRVAVAGMASSQGGHPPHREIEAGDAVWAKDAHGDLLPRRAITGGISGHDFPVVWVCKEQDYDEALRHSYPPERGDYNAPGVPWPIEDVTVRDSRALDRPLVDAQPPSVGEAASDE